MSVEFHHTETTFSQSLDNMANSLTSEIVTLREIIGDIGEQGLLLICMFLMLPFLFPISIPGISTVFSIAVILTGIGVMLNRVPWLPNFVLQRPFNRETIVNALHKGAKFIGRIDKFIHPRFHVLTANVFINRIHGITLIFAGLLLVLPLGLIPFSNTLPAVAVIFLSAGIIQRDGLCIVLGYISIFLSVIYFGGLTLAVLMAGNGIGQLLGA
ncbi:MAG: exopolysaccharide biosynthesis protein [Anaerolineae bacterium]|nr:exopolysaccharide biosynthesis protein [Anaerolineae bacterium]